MMLEGCVCKGKVLGSLLSVPLELTAGLDQHYTPAQQSLQATLLPVTSTCIMSMFIV